jgi:preprotein translocase subunit SecF
MEFFRTPHLKYISNRKYFFGISGVLGVITVVSLLTRGPNFSIDFTGGTLVEATFTKAPVSIGDVRKALDQAGLNDAQLQSVPGQNTVIIRFKSKEGLKQELATKIEAALADSFPDNPVDKNRTRAEYVGPIVGKHIMHNASPYF